MDEIFLFALGAVSGGQVTSGWSIFANPANSGCSARMNGQHRAAVGIGL
ncbi:MAG TPA: hypothetical protein VFH45_11055 [Acidimicrobiales bacterium]|nr:hypothetical protein [Acidimicrobiales bacterium]